jgi:sulfhydrogenase subunit alpha
MTQTIKINHLARVEGHGGIEVEIDGKKVNYVHFDVFEGARLLESLVRGRDYRDVSQIVSRICAICSVAHAVTSIKATEDAFGVEPDAQTHLLRDLMFRGENIESHALHVFLLALPDYLGYPSAPAMVDDYPDAVALALRLKKLGNLIQETVGGRAVHPVKAVVGGFASVPSTHELIELRDTLEKAREEIPVALDLVAALPAAGFCDVDTAFAAIPCPDDYGYYRGESVEWMGHGDVDTIAAGDYRSLANETVVGHSHAKHSHYRDEPFMVGALARVALNEGTLHPTARAAMGRLRLGPPYRNPMDNNLAQAVELVHDVEVALETVDALLRQGLSWTAPVTVKPRAGTGTAVTEAPRGLLVHNYEFDAEGRVVAADVITPTAFNAASVENHMRAAVEQCDDPADLDRRLQMIARAYDPCISCSVHVIRK